MNTVTTTQIQNNFGKYLKEVMNGNEFVIVKNGKEVARLISKENTVSFLTDSLVGILHSDYNELDIKKEKNKKHEAIY